MPIPEVVAVVSGIKVVIDIAKGLKSAHDAHTITQAQSDILEKLLDLRIDALSLQEKTSTLINEKEELAKKLMEFEKWAETERQYELAKLPPGILVYAQKKSGTSTEPKHWLCTNCWKDRKKSILQLEYTGAHTCPECKHRFDIEMEP
jgi:hypothetical protein